MIRNVSINDDSVNKFLDSLPKRTRSYYIEQSILLNMRFNNNEYVKKQDVEDFVKIILNNISTNIDVQTKPVNNSIIYDTIKDSITNILNL